MDSKNNNIFLGKIEKNGCYVNNQSIMVNMVTF